MVAAAGNESTSALTYPAAYPGVIGVSSINERKKRSGFSNYGSYVDVAAPGGTAPSDEDNGTSLFDGFQDGILSTVFANEYSQLIGTSMAAPMVSGVAALLLSQNPNMSWRELKDTILSSVEPVSRFRGKNRTGGRLSAKGAINLNR